MAFIQRYSDIKRGGIIFTGNTLGLSKASNTNTAGFEGSIGAFTSLDNTLSVNNFPLGTTLDYLQNGSTAQLNMPAGSTVLYAELVWGGLFRSSVNNISSIINNNVTFITPSGSFSISSDISTRQDFNITNDGNTVGFYVRSANVTSIIQSSQNGSYSLTAVPALIEAIDNRTNETNHAGWTLAVVFSNSSLPFRSLNLWAGGVVVSPNSQTDITLTGFKTPQVVTPSGKLFVSAQEGDAVLSGDSMLFGEDTTSLTSLSGPNNPVNNFFCSQINDENGLIDTSGTFGSRNANAASGTNTLACRQGYDITAIDLTGKITNGQTNAAIRFTSVGDLYVPNCLALAIDNGANPDISIIKGVDKAIAVKGDTLVYTSTITDTGDIPLVNVFFADDIPIGTTFTNGSVTINGINYPLLNPQTGFNIGNLIPNQSVIVTFEVTVN